MKRPKAVVDKVHILLIILAFGMLLGLSTYIYIKVIHKSSLPTAALDLAIYNKSQQATPSLVIPIRLQIPKIQVDATVDLMGVTTNGLLEAPAGPKTVGWYKYGPRPGDVGSAVIDGHYGRWANGEGSVFDSLNTLKKGDTFAVVDSKGITITFVVRELKTYNPKADDTAVFHSSDGLAHLNLITCDGSWSSSSQGYSRRLVVFADKK